MSLLMTRFCKLHILRLKRFLENID